MVQYMPKWVRLGNVGRLCQQVYDDFGVVGGLEDMAVCLVLVPQQRCVNKIAVMRYRHLAATVFT